MPSFFEKNAIKNLCGNGLKRNGSRRYSFYVSSNDVQPFFNPLIAAVNVSDIMNDGFSVRDKRRDKKRKPRAQIGTLHFPSSQWRRPFYQNAMLVKRHDISAHAPQFFRVSEPSFKD
jgi:hypothetical protein